MATGVNGADQFAADLMAAAAEIEAGNAAVVKATAKELVKLVRERAPVGDTGDYRDSWRTEPKIRRGEVTVSVFTEAPQAARLEYGFHGIDSLGRVYDVAPQAHQQPANDVVYPDIPVALNAVVDKALRSSS